LENIFRKEKLVLDCQRADLEYGEENGLLGLQQRFRFKMALCFSSVAGLIVEIKDEKIIIFFYIESSKKGSDFYDSKANKILVNWKTVDKLKLDYYNDPYKDFKPNSAGNNFSEGKIYRRTVTK
jgi:hypothetical protein